MIPALLMRMAIAAPLASFASQVAAAPPRGEIVLIRSRIVGIVCTGICTEFDLAVRSNGMVTYRGGIIHHVPHVVRFRISPAEFERFRQALQPVRPVGERGPLGQCNAPGAIPGKIAINIRWRGGGPRGHLRACWGTEDVSMAEYRALKALRITSMGKRLSPEEAEQYYHS